MRSKYAYVLLIAAPVGAYVLALFLVAALVVKPPALGWVGFAVAAAIGIGIGGLAIFFFPRTRTNAGPVRKAEDDVHRLLVLADAGCPGEPLCDAVGLRLGSRKAEVMVIAPVLASPLHFLTEEEEHETTIASRRLAETLALLTHAGISAHGTVGADDPLQAIGDALPTFPADEVLVLAHEAGEQTWLEHGVEQSIRELYALPVVRSIVRAEAAVA